MPYDDCPERHSLDQDHSSHAGADQLPSDLQDYHADAEVDVDLLDQVHANRRPLHDRVPDIHSAGDVVVELPAASHDSQGCQPDHLELPASTDDHFDYLGHIVHDGGQEELHYRQDVEHSHQDHCLPGVLCGVHAAGQAHYATDQASLCASRQRYRWHGKLHRSAILACSAGLFDASHDIQDGRHHQPFERVRDRNDLLRSFAARTVGSGHDVQDPPPDQLFQRLRDHDCLLRPAAASRFYAHHHVRDAGRHQPIERL